MNEEENKMLVYKQWAKVSFGKVEKEYRTLLLFGIIPLWISING